MSDVGAGASGDEAVLKLSPEEFVRKMEQYERILVDLKELLYEGSWDRISMDLRNARDDKPHVYRLSHAIDRDLKAIERLKAYEARHSISLSDVLKKHKN